MDERTPKEIKPLRVFVLTTEQSAEAILQRLLKPLRAAFPDMYVEGVVSSTFPQEGIHLFETSDKLRIMGLIDVVFSIGRILKMQKRIKKRILENDFDLVLTIDSSSFHLPLVEDLKKRGCKAKFVHAVCPPIWAYRPHRKPRIANTFDLLLPLFRFESPLFSDTKLPSLWIGHPFQSYQPVKKDPIEQNILLIFPGSRKRVIKRNLPLQLAAAKKFPYKIVVSIACPTLKKDIEKLAPGIETVEKMPDQKILGKTVLALATSGTITLELALLSIPTVVTYKIPLIDAIAAKLAKMQVPFFALPNLLTNREIFIELIHPFTTVKEVVAAMKKTLYKSQPIPFSLLQHEILTPHTNQEIVQKIVEKTAFCGTLKEG